jgi:diguanylate cyclase (GGDEF)-like protein
MPPLQTPPRHIIHTFPVAPLLGNYIEQRPKKWIAVTGYLLFIVIAILDYLTTPNHITILLAYSFPIFILAWFVSPVHGTLISALSALLNFGIDLLYLSTFPNPLDPIINGFLAIGIFVAVARTVSLMRAFIENEQSLARTDPVTGAANQRAFYELAEYELGRAQRTKAPLSLASIDLDNFKAVNDRWGHAVGDTALRTVVTTIKTHIRSTDQLARVGGDEFILFLPQTDAQAAQTTLNRVQAKLLDAMQTSQWPVTFSVGVVTFLSPPATIDSALKQADEFMYSVKRSGKNRIEYHVVA